MRRTLLVLTSAATALLLAACSGAEGPGWTFAAPTAAPAVTPAPSTDATAAPDLTPVPGGETGGISVAALNVAFDKAELTAPADTKFTINFDNQDAGIPHNVAIKDSMGTLVFTGEIVNGPAQKAYSVDPLAAGDYQFVCTVHPNMIGTLKVGG